MNYLHYDVNLKSGDIVEVSLDKQANVRLMDQYNYNQYRSGMGYKFHGGLAKVSPIRLDAPRPGHWHLVIDLGGYPGTVRASVQVKGG